MGYSLSLSGPLSEGGLREPTEQFAHSLRRIADGVAALGRASAAPALLSDWLRVSPLISFQDDAAPVMKLHPLERDLGAWLGHVENICRAPRADLHTETEHQQVGRVRRVAPDAVAFLAAHTEDWEARTLRGVRPRRVLALIPADLLDLYENRVVARLIDHLLRHLRRRLASLAALERFYNFEEYVRGTPWRKGRVYRLWGGTTDSAQQLQRAQDVKATLQGLLRRLRGLLDSPLYRAVPRTAEVGRVLRVTNILAHDPDYQYVARLWQSWTREVVPESDTERRERCRAYEARFIAYAHLLFVHALCDLGADQASRLPPGPGPEVEIQTRFGAIRLVIAHNGALLLSGADRPVLQILPCAAALATARADPLGQFDLALRHLAPTSDGGERDQPPARAQRGRPRETPRGSAQAAVAQMLLYPSPSAQERELLPPRKLLRMTCPGADPQGGPAGLVPVSPLMLDSVERVARILHRWLATSLYLGGGEISTRRDAPERAALATCPTCGKDGEVSPRDPGFFARCRCGTSWGTIACGGCGENSPFIQPWQPGQPGQPVLGLEGPPVQADWVDALIGRDALALPCPGSAGLDVFICQHCGACPRQQQRAESCVRCRALR